MSYCRFGPDSDVYVYEHVDGFICCSACILIEPGPGEPWRFEAFSAAEMNEHLRQHVAAGHQVPEGVIGD